jgi:hypothetical protein
MKNVFNSKKNLRKNKGRIDRNRTDHTFQEKDLVYV